MLRKAVLTLLTVIIALPSWANDDRFVSVDIPYGVRLTPVNIPSGPGLMTLEYRIIARLAFDTMVVKVKTFGNLECLGDTSWVVRNEGKDTMVYYLNVMIPPNDTSGIEVDLYVRRGCANGDDRYFVTTGDTLEIYKSWPKPRELPPPDIGIPDSLLPGYGKPVVYTTERGYVDTIVGQTRSLTDWQKKEVIERRPLTRYPGQLIFFDGEPWIRFRGECLFQPADSTNYNDSVKIMKSRSMTDKQKKEVMEWAPLTKYNVQTIQVDGEQWLRRKGEYKFKRIEGKTLEEIAQEDEERKERQKHIEVDAVLDLRNPDNYAYVKELVKELVPMEEEGYYRATITKGLSAELTRRGITITNYPIIPGQWEKNKPNSSEDEDSPRRRKEKWWERQQRQTDWELLFEEYFENSLENHWRTFDQNSANDYDYWDTISTDVWWAYVSEGSYSAWCSRIGTRPYSNMYDNYMDAWMIAQPPIDVSDYSNIEAYYDIWYRTEDSYPEIYDYCAVYYSFNGYNYYRISDIYYEDSYGWKYNEYFPLNVENQDSLYIGFRFYSDETYTYWGAFVDFFQVIGERQPQPDLEPCAYYGWYGPIVPDAEPNTNWPSALFAAKPTYIDVSVANTGEGNAGPFHTALYIDDNLITKFHSQNPLGEWDYFRVEDYITTLSYDWHTLKIILDCDNEVNESREDNNVYSEYFRWDSLSVHIEGHVEYSDLGDGGNKRNTRNIIVELWDENTTADVKVSPGTDTITTDDYGNFDFGSLMNYDTEGSGELDPYIKVFAENHAAKLYVNPYPNGPTYSFNTQTHYNIWNDLDTTITASDSQSGHFYVVDRVLDGYNKWVELTVFKSKPTQVGVVFQQSYPTSYQSSNYIRINTEDIPDWGAPDVFDGDVILHEYGHKLECQYDFFDSTISMAHHWWDSITVENAACEGFAHFWSAYVTNDSIIRNTWTNFTKYLDKNIENGEWGWNGSIDSSCNNYGKQCEGAVAGILWDIYDNNDDDYTRWSGSPGAGYPDNVADTYSDGDDIPLIIGCLLNKGVPAPHPDNLDEFWEYWFLPPSYNYKPEMWAIWYEHGDNKDTVGPTGTISIRDGASTTGSVIVDVTLNMTDTLSGMAPPRAAMQFSNDMNHWSPWEDFSPTKTDWDLSAYGGNSNHGVKTVYAYVSDAAWNCPLAFSDQIEYLSYVCGDANGDGNINIGDAVYVSEYIFHSGPPPDPLEAGDANCDGSINVGDVVYIHNYVFCGGPPPCCP
jgi:hypothetical protein